MSENSRIEWTDHTFNPWIGCQSVSPGCDNCYAEAMMDKRLKKVQWGPGAARERTKPANWHNPVAWNANHELFYAAHGRRQMVFCASLADVFDNAVPDQWRADLLQLIDQTPNLDWLLLTKRVGNVAGMLPAGWLEAHPNVWIGASIVNQAEADRDIPKLLAVPARVRFLSMEPLLGPVDITAHIPPPKLPWLTAGTPLCRELPSHIGCARVGPHYPGEFGCRWSKINSEGSWPGVDWVIAGGESGPGARPMHPDWARGLRDQCAAAGVPYLFKQWGEWLPAIKGRSLTGLTLILEGAAPFTDNPQWHSFDDGQQTARVGKKAAGRKLDGMHYDGVPNSVARGGA